MMNVEKQTSKCCAFCLNLGIPQPHDHTVRDFGKKDKPTICPKLLQSECGYCHQIGHTKNYCSKLKDKKISNANSSSRSVGTSSDKKRVYMVDKDGFTCISSNTRTNSSHIFEQNKVQKVGMLMSAFGALDIEGDSDENEAATVDVKSNDSDHKQEIDTPVETDNKLTWASVVSSTQKKVRGFITQQEMRDNLGIKLGTSWADDDEDDI